MAIKINWQDLLKRFINWQEIVRVYKNGVQIRPETVPPVTPLLCFTSEEIWSSVALASPWTSSISLEISYDGDTWSDYNFGTTISLSAIGDKVYMRNKSSTPTAFSNFNFVYRYIMAGKISASWDINYLLCKYSTSSLVWDGCFNNLFSNCTALTTMPSLLATNLTYGCYSLMFDWCTSLTSVQQQLPATTLASACYQTMFRGCTSLTTAPQLPATVLADGCYFWMFDWCTSLATAPQLPATTLAWMCYDNMFMGCVSLVTPPSLPATSLSSSCYSWMFSWCTWLEIIPSLPAEMLSSFCYANMFSWCTSIKLSETPDIDYQNEYRIPTEWMWIETQSSLENMFSYTWWTFTGTPNINQTYYTSNQVI